MGNCLYILEKRDLNGPTFSHYSLTSNSSFLDLYPGLSYVESESCYPGCQETWRRSSAPLIDLEASSSNCSSPGSSHLQSSILHLHSSTSTYSKPIPSSRSDPSMKQGSTVTL
ncbi:uncharacterized protein LOC111710587 [Eurytemora carolleeae]|uniref:uncharacterized protein LOC111710587 n=1 Tax=Eurytemora carolleeae TaxID=1294199 RepID=UPI000C77BA61|nr:uncharacterized protein LOC111710587 [Eurytemora carolleeae]XP_023340466.1 uncharacterized protein LOC111710587 [Eurytemora carolleeae]|eukprot:XP_023340465.1 uncharacterized protein LOC111710587 [Eurytemora affinis]